MEAAEMVLMRKIGPAYAALEGGDYKSAIKLCERKDLAASGLARALKAFALERKAFLDSPQKTANTTDLELVQARRSRFQEAMDVALGVAESKTVNVREVHLLMLTFRNLGRFDKVVEAYDNVFASQPTIENGQDLLFWHLPAENFDTMQKLSLQLAKLDSSQKSLYMGWAATILVVHAKLMANRSADDREAALKKLAFAEMLLQRLVNETPIHGSSKDGAEASEADGEDEEDMPASAKVLADSLRWTLVTALVLQGKVEPAIAVAEKELAHLQARERLLLLAELRQLNGERSGNADELDAAARLYLELLSEHDPEDWRNWSGYLESACGACAARGAPFDSIMEAIDELTTRAQAANGDRLQRGPRLAKVMLRYRELLASFSASRAVDDRLAVQFTDELCNYLTCFDNKACAFGDVRNLVLCFCADSSGGALLASRNPEWPPTCPPNTLPVYLVAHDLGKSLFEEQQIAKWTRRWPVEDFAALIDGTVRDKLVGFLQERATAASATARQEDAPKDDRKKALRTVITSYQILRFIGCWEGLEDKVLADKCDELVSLYAATTCLDEGGQGGEREVKVGDDLVLLASHGLVDLCNRQPQQEMSLDGRSYLLSAASILETAYKHSPAGFQLALAMMEVYARLDMLSRICELYTALDIKHVQIDSLSHLVLGDAYEAGMWAEASQCCSNVDMLWKGSRYENVDFMRRAFRQGNFRHGAEIVRLDQLLKFSHQRIMAISESFTLDALRGRLESWDCARDFLGESLNPAMETEPKVKARMADLIDWLPNIEMRDLSANYDFTVRVSADCPLGRTATLESEKLSLAKTPLPIQPRACTSIRNFDMRWYARGLDWLKLRAALALLVREALNLASGTATGDESLQKAVETFKSKLDNLQLASKASSDQRAVSMWGALVSALEASVLLQNAKFEEASTVEPVLVKLAEIVAALETAQPTAADATAREVAHHESQTLLWLVLLTRSWMDLAPRKKKKKKKDDSGPLAKFQNAVAAVAGATMATLDSFGKAVANLKAAPSESEAFKSKLANTDADRFANCASAYHANSSVVADKLAETLNELHDILKSAKY